MDEEEEPDGSEDDEVDALGTAGCAGKEGGAHERGDEHDSGEQGGEARGTEAHGGKEHDEGRQHEAKACAGLELHGAADQDGHAAGHDEEQGPQQQEPLGGGGQRGQHGVGHRDDAAEVGDDGCGAARKEEHAAGYPEGEEEPPEGGQEGAPMKRLHGEGTHHEPRHEEQQRWGEHALEADEGEGYEVAAHGMARAVGAQQEVERGGEEHEVERGATRREEVGGKGTAQVEEGGGEGALGVAEGEHAIGAHKEVPSHEDEQEVTYEGHEALGGEQTPRHDAKRGGNVGCRLAIGHETDELLHHFSMGGLFGELNGVRGR